MIENVIELDRQALETLEKLNERIDNGEDVPIYKFLEIISSQLTALTGAVAAIYAKSDTCCVDPYSAFCADINPKEQSGNE